jgi:Zinc knuckle
MQVAALEEIQPSYYAVAAFSKDIPQNGDQRQQGGMTFTNSRDNRNCHKCGELGHIARFCPNGRAQATDQGLTKTPVDRTQSTPAGANAVPLGIRENNRGPRVPYTGPPCTFCQGTTHPETRCFRNPDSDDFKPNWVKKLAARAASKPSGNGQS